MTYFLFTSRILPNANISRNTEQILFSQIQSNYLQIEFFQIYATGQSRWPLADVTKNSKNMKMTILKHL